MDIYLILLFFMGFVLGFIVGYGICKENQDVAQCNSITNTNTIFIECKYKDNILYHGEILK